MADNDGWFSRTIESTKKKGQTFLKEQVDKMNKDWDAERDKKAWPTPMSQRRQGKYTETTGVID